MPRSLRVAIVVAVLAAHPCRADEPTPGAEPVPAGDADGGAAAPAPGPPADPASGDDGTIESLPTGQPPTEPPPTGPAPGDAVPPLPDSTTPSPPAADVAPANAPAADGGVPPRTDLTDRPTGAASDLLAAVLGPGDAGTTAAPESLARPLTLFEAVRQPGDPSRRLWIAQAYWKAATACAWVRWAGEAVERLELVAPGADPHDRAVLDVAAAAARADLAEARTQCAVAQQELVDLARLPFTDPLPRPVDLPLAAPYETHFEAIFATRIATGRTRAIARTLPARHEAIEARAVAVAAAGTAAAMAEADHARGRRPIEAVITAHAMLVGQQREFLAAVRAYNADIAEYAMAAADLSVPDDRFVSMLIGPPPVARP